MRAKVLLFPAAVAGLVAGMLWLTRESIRPAASAAPPPQSGCAADVSILHPANGAVLSIGNGRSMIQDYLAVSSCQPRVCAYSEQNVGYDRMTPFSNPGDGLYQTTRIIPQPGASYTYYIACRAADGSTTKPVQVSFSMAAKPSTTPAGVRAFARSPYVVEVAALPPDGGAKQFKIFRDGVLVATTSAYGMTDRGLKPNTLYRYSIAAVGPDGDQPSSPAVPARTPRAAEGNPDAPALVLDDFEAPIRVMNPHLPEPTKHNLWSVYPGGDLSRATASIGTASITTEEAHGGKSSLKAVVTGATPPPTKRPGGLDLLFYPYTERDNHWHFLREQILQGQWKTGVYNRMRFWVKVPQSFAGARRTGGQTNTDIGTYVRSSRGPYIGSGGSESGLGGGHFYHRYNIPYSGEWHQVILDSHPTHQRGAPGYVAFPDMPNPTGEDGYNYLDLLTTFYIDMDSLRSLSEYPATFYFDDFEVYREPNAENTEQVFSMHGVYIPAANEIFVGWSHPKDDDKTRHEVRYSFEDIHKIGWAKAIPAPAGIVKPLGSAYNAMEYSTNQIRVAGHDHVMIAIKPQNSESFRQIAIPVKPRN